MRGPTIFLRYVVFCAMATLANLGVQYLASESFGQPLIICLFSGTAVGLVLKYVLDRNFIFDGRGVGLRRDSARFLVYSLFGLLTTLLFWAVEWAVARLFHHPISMYVGGALGLIIGYIIKYHLDRRWVFGPETQPL